MPQHSSDDAVLLEHLLLANRQLRSVLADAGCPLPELALPANLQQLQEDEAMALLAEENYQLRQLLQQLQHQQQLQELEQQLVLQQELELNHSGLDFDRLSPSPEQPQQQQPHGCSPAALGADGSSVVPQSGSPAVVLDSSSSRGWASPAGGVLSPVAARLVAAPSLNTVQLVEAEAAAQLATQAVIQAEAEAHQHMSWQLQQPLQDQQYSLLYHEEQDPQQAVRSIKAAQGAHEGESSSSNSSRNYLQQQDNAATNGPVGGDVLLGSQQQGLYPAAAAASLHQQQQQQEERELTHQLSSGRLAQLPQLPRLTLPRVVTGRRSQESTCSEAGRSSLCSPAYGDFTHRSQAAGSASQQPPSAVTAASARSNASSSSCSGLKQLTNDLLLLPPALRSAAATAGPNALQETFGRQGSAAAGALCADYENGARGFGLGHASAAAGLAADAAAGIWFPAPAAAEGSSLTVVGAAIGSREQPGSMYSPSSRAADVATNAVKGIMYPGSMLSDQGAAASAGSGAAAADDAVSKPRLRLPASVFANANEAAAAAAAAADLGDAAGVDQWQRGMYLADQQQHPVPHQVQQQYHHHQPPQQQQLQQQQWQQYQQPQLGLQVQMPNLPPISTGPRHASGGGQALPPHASLQSGAGAVCQAAAAAAALAGQRFQPQHQPHLQQQQQQQQQQETLPQQQQLAAPFPALRLPPRVQTFQQQQHEQQTQAQQHQQQEGHTPSSWGDDCSSGVPPSLPRLRLPGQRHSAAPAAAAASTAADAEAPAALAGLARLQMPAAAPNSYSSSPEGSPCSDSGFFRAADAGLFDGGSSGFLDAGADMFGTRISMDDSGRRLSYGEAQPSQLPGVPEDYFGLPDATDSGEAEGYSFTGSQHSGWLGVSYQQHSVRTSAAQGSGPLGSAAGSRELSQFAPLSGAASCEDGSGSYGGFRRRRGQCPGPTDTIDELAEWGDELLCRQDTRGSGWSGSCFVATAAAGSMSSLTSGAPSHQVSFQGGISTHQHSDSAQAAAAAAAAAVQRGLAQQQEQELPAFPNLAPLRVCTGRTQQQEQTPPLTWQPQAMRMDSGSSTHSALGRLPSSTAAAAAAAATSPAHMAAAEAAEAAASVGLAQAASGGMDSQQLQQLLTHLARVAEEASATTISAAVTAGRPSQPAGKAPPAPVRPSAFNSTAAAAAAAADGSAGYGEQQEDKQQQHTEPLLQQDGQHLQQHLQQQQCPAPAAADCCTPVARGSGSDQQCHSGQGGPLPLSPFASAGINSPARGAAAGCLVLSPRPAVLQRTLSAGHMAPAAGLPPKWTSRSGSSSNLPALLSQPSHPSPRRQPHVVDDTAGHAQDQQGHSRAASAAVSQALPCAGAHAERAATMPAGVALAAAPAGTLVSPRLGLHGRLRVITHAAAGAGNGYSSNGSNSDADAGSAHTTPMHRPPQGAAVLRTNSGSSFRPAGLASITVPPSPASSGVRYVPASPRVVGFDCPLTPHAYALRSPSWRSETGAEGGSSMGCHSHTLACGSGSSTPRRQASSPGLLQQALARSGMGPHQHHSQPLLGHSGPGSGAGSGCNTPSSAASAARRAASAGNMPSAAAGAAAAAGFAAVAADGSHGNSSNGGLKLAGSCSSSALLMTMMGGQLPVLHHQRTSSYPYIDTVHSPGSAHRSRFSASGLDPAAAEDAGASRALPAAAAAAAGGGGEGGGSGADVAAASRRAGASDASSRSSSSDSDTGSTPRHSRPDGVAYAPAAADRRADLGPAMVSPPDAPQAPMATAAVLDAALQLPRSLSPQLGRPSSRSVSPSLQHQQYQQHQQQQQISPPTGSAAEAGQHKLSRFGLAAARASTEKPLAEKPFVEKPLAASSSKAGDAAEMLLALPPQGLTAVLMTVGQQAETSSSDSGCGGPAAADDGSGCSDNGHCASTSSSDGGYRHGEDSALAAAGAGDMTASQGAAAAAVAVPDTPAIDQAASGAAFASQHSLEHELAAVQEGDSLAGLLIEQELQRAAAEASPPAAASETVCQAAGEDSTAALGVCAGSAAATSCYGPMSASAATAGCGAASHAARSSSGGCGSSDAGSNRAAGSSSTSARQRVTWCGDSSTSSGGPTCTGGCGSSTGCEGCSHHAPPASPCTPQQDAEQQQQQPLQSPDRHMQQQLGQHQEQQQQHVWQGRQAGHAPHLQQQQLGMSACSSGSPGRSKTLPRSKSAAAYLAGPGLTAGSRSASDTGGAAMAAAAEGAGAASGSRDSMWSPTHDVRGGSGRHRSPSALLMRLSQKQVEVLMAQGRASTTVPYVLPHRSSNPASALRALTATGSVDCINSNSQGPDQSSATGLVAAAAAGNTPRSTPAAASSPSSSPGAQHPLQPASSWDVEQLAPPEDLFAVATAPTAATGVYIPLPRAESAASTGSPQLQQRPLHQYGSEELVGSASGSADNREVVRSAAIVQQRLKSTSKWLGPAPVVAASAAAAEAEAAAVVTRRRSLQHDGANLQHASSSGGRGAGTSSRVATATAALAASAAPPDSPNSLHRASSSGGGKVAMQAAALAASNAATTAAGDGLRSSSSGGISSRVAATAAALAASSAAAGVEPAVNASRVAAKLRPGAAWLAAAAAGSKASTAPAGQARAVRQHGSSTPAQSQADEQPTQQGEQQVQSTAAAATARSSEATEAAAAASDVASISKRSIEAAACHKQQPQQPPPLQQRQLDSYQQAAAAADSNASVAGARKPPCEGRVPRHGGAAEAPAGVLDPAVVSIGSFITAAPVLDAVPAAAATASVAACSTLVEGCSFVTVDSSQAAAPVAADGTPVQSYSGAAQVLLQALHLEGEGGKDSTPEVAPVQSSSSTGQATQELQLGCAGRDDAAPQLVPVQSSSSTGQAPQELQPGCAGRDDAAPQAFLAQTSSSTGQAPQQLQLGCAGRDDAGEVAAAVRSRQQQLLKQRQLLRAQQQQAKRQEVAAWALAHQQQQQLLQAEQSATVLDSTAGVDTPADGLCDAAAGAGAIAAAVSEGTGSRPELVTSSAAGAVTVSGAAAMCNSIVVAAAAGSSHAPDSAAVAAIAAGAEAAAAAAGGACLDTVGLGLQRCDSIAFSVADSFEVQSWAAWSTTSSINRCPKLEWWGTDGGQARFSQRQRRQQRQGEGGVQGAWWRRLLQASKQQGGPAGGPAGRTL